MQPKHARLFSRLTLTLLVLASSGCATILTRPQQHVPIDSAPPGAAVYVDGTFVGTTPMRLALDKRTEHELLLRLGGQEQVVTLRSEVAGTFVMLDIAPGLVIAGLAAIVLTTTPDSDPTPPEGGWGTLPAPWIVHRAVRGAAGIGIGIGLGSAALNVAIDASTGQWYQLTPNKVLVLFD